MQSQYTLLYFYPDQKDIYGVVRLVTANVVQWPNWPSHYFQLGAKK